MRSISPIILLLSAFPFAHLVSQSVPIYIKSVSEDNQTVTYQANPLYEVCTCDLTSISCDINCCCDNDCSFALRSKWVEEKKCSNIDYQSLRGSTLGKCVKNSEIYEYNRKRGL